MAKRDLTGAVDFAYLENYAGGDQQVVGEVLAMFREQAALWARLIDPAAEAGQAEGWRDAVHTLKGSARSIGAGPLGDACAAAEATPDATRSAALGRVLDALDLALSDIAAYLHEQALKSLKI